MIYHTKFYINEKGIGFSVARFEIKKGRIIDRISGKDVGELRRTK